MEHLSRKSARAALAISSPLFDRVALRPPEGTSFIVEAPGNPASAPYIASAILNGKASLTLQIDPAVLMRSGRLLFKMSAASAVSSFGRE